jgi:hypothetical protein
MGMNAATLKTDQMQHFFTFFIKKLFNNMLLPKTYDNNIQFVMLCPITYTMLRNMAKV